MEKITRDELRKLVNQWNTHFTNTTAYNTEFYNTSTGVQPASTFQIYQIQPQTYDEIDGLVNIVNMLIDELNKKQDK